MVGRHHRLDRHESEQALGVGDGQGSLTCCSPRGHRVRHDRVTELNFDAIVPIYLSHLTCNVTATKYMTNILLHSRC